MTMMLISDLHFDKRKYKGHDESLALDVLKDCLRFQKSDNVIAMGDLGHAWTVGQWNEMAKSAKFHVLYGNHDNLGSLLISRNKDGSSILVNDGEIRRIEGLSCGFINGIINENIRIKEYVPRKTNNEFISVMRDLEGKVDAICMHEGPNFGNANSTPGSAAVKEELQAIYTNSKIRNNGLTLKFVFSGHVDNDAFAYDFVGDTFCIRVNTSTMFGTYLTVENDKKMLNVWKHKEVLARFSFAGGKVSVIEDLSKNKEVNKEMFFAMR